MMALVGLVGSCLFFSEVIALVDVDEKDMVGIVMQMLFCVWSLLSEKAPWNRFPRVWRAPNFAME